jgi:hypothetical protein
VLDGAGEPASGDSSLVAVIVARGAPSVTMSSSLAWIERSVPLQGEGISASTLSVATSKRGVPSFTESPGVTSHRVITASVTCSPGEGTATMASVSDMVALRSQVERRAHDAVGVDAVISVDRIEGAHLPKLADSQ